MILIGLGANLNSIYGSPRETLNRCTDLLYQQSIFVIRSSSVWNSAPIPVSDQPWYCNAVCEIDTTHNPHELLAILNQIEHDVGRVRGVRDESRTLDLDILSYHDVIMNDDDLTIPHPRMHDRAFILYPLREFTKDWLHPILCKNVTELIAAMPEGQGIERIEHSALPCVNR